MSISLGVSVERVANLGVGGGENGVSSPYLIQSMQPALVSISSDGGPCTGQRKGLGLHIQFQVGGAHRSLVRGALKGGGKGAKSLTTQFEPENRLRDGGRQRERGKGPPFGM